MAYRLALAIILLGISGACVLWIVKRESRKPEALGIPPEQLEAYVARLSKRIDTGSDNGLLRLNRAIAHRRLGKFKAAAEDFRAVIENDKHNYYAYFEFAVLEYEHGYSFLEEINQAIEICPKSAPARTMRAAGLNYGGDYDWAIIDARIAIDVAPTMARAHYECGRAHAGLGQHHDAVKNFEKAIELEGTHALAHSKVAGSLYELGDVEAAMQAFARSIQLDPECYDAYENRGRINLLEGRHNAALADLTQAVKLRVKGCDAVLFRGIAYLYLDRFEEAIVDFSQAIGEDSLDWKRRALAGDAFFAAEEYDRAIENYLDAIEEKPDESGAYSRLANALISTDRFEAARRELKTAAALGDESFFYFRTLGLLELELDNVGSAIKAFSHAISLAEKDSGHNAYRGHVSLADMYASRARAYKTNGQDELASEDAVTAERILAKVSDRKVSRASKLFGPMSEAGLNDRSECWQVGKEW